MKMPWNLNGSGGDNRRPPNRGPGSRRPIRRAGLGLLYIAIGRREGFEDFGNTPEAYLASLAPLIAFDLVTCVLAAASGAIHAALLMFLMLICSWLAPAVISHPLARIWGKAEAWPRYANILNWAQMLMFLVLSLASAGAKLAVTAGLPANPFVPLILLTVPVYGLWFQWFVARGVLKLNWWRTVLLLLAVIVGSNLLISGPLLVTGGGANALKALTTGQMQ